MVPKLRFRGSPLSSNGNLIVKTSQKHDLRKSNVCWGQGNSVINQSVSRAHKINKNVDQGWFSDSDSKWLVTADCHWAGKLRQPNCEDTVSIYYYFIFESDTHNLQPHRIASHYYQSNSLKIPPLIRNRGKTRGALSGFSVKWKLKWWIPKFPSPPPPY